MRLRPEIYEREWTNETEHTRKNNETRQLLDKLIVEDKEIQESISYINSE